MADEQTKPPFNREPIVPKGYVNQIGLESLPLEPVR